MGIKKLKEFKDKSEMKGMYKDDYENYETGDWLDIERELDKDYIPKNDHDKWRHMAYMGQYRELFEQLGTKFENLNVFDYHNLYNCILERITSNILLDHLWVISCGEKTSVTYENIETAFVNEREKLDNIFNEFVSEIKSKPETTNKTDENKKKGMPDFKNDDQPLTELQKHLIHKNLLFPDGKRVIKNLDQVAAEVVLFTRQPITSQYLRESFLKSSGSEYCANTCDNARDYANTQ
jgi:hypothetical protein